MLKLNINKDLLDSSNKDGWIPLSDVGCGDIFYCNGGVYLRSRIPANSNTRVGKAHARFLNIRLDGAKYERSFDEFAIHQDMDSDTLCLLLDLSVELKEVRPMTRFAG